MTLPGSEINPDRYEPPRRRASRAERAEVLERVLYEPTVLCLCTGNAARSPIAQVLLSDAIPGANVRSAGTHAISGQPVSWRTRMGLEVVRPELSLKVNVHRSHQVTRRDLGSSDLVLCMASEHVEYIRREFPEAAERSGTIRRLARELEPGHLVSLPDRIAEMGLASVALEAWEDVDDPAGGDVEDFVRCATALDGLVAELAARMAVHRMI